jgi:hypothetical protein
VIIFWADLIETGQNLIEDPGLDLLFERSRLQSETRLDFSRLLRAPNPLKPPKTSESARCLLDASGSAFRRLARPM